MGSNAPSGSNTPSCTSLTDCINRYTTIKSELNSYPLASKYQTFQSNFDAYIQSSGISSIPYDSSGQNPLWKAAHDSWLELKTHLISYQTLNQNLTATLGTYGTQNINNLLQGLGTKQRSLSDLQNSLEAVNQEYDIAKSRQDSVKNANKDQSFFQGFSAMIGFTRPIKKLSVALFLGIGFFIIIMCGIILRDHFSSSLDIATQYTDLSDLTNFTSSGQFKMALVGVSFTFMVFAIATYLYFKYS
jgi:hypothetical protein